MQSSRPLLVIVSGAPASGKTTLAIRLAADGRMGLLSKDALKEALADAAGAPGSVAASRSLGQGAYAALFAIAAARLADGEDMVLESNFRRGVAEAELRGLAAHSEIRLVHCSASPATIARRYARREGRHPAHLDAARHDDVMRELAEGVYQPLELDAPLMVVETDDGGPRSYDDIRAFALDRRA